MQNPCRVCSCFAKFQYSLNCVVCLVCPFDSHASSSLACKNNEENYGALANKNTLLGEISVNAINAIFNK